MIQSLKAVDDLEAFFSGYGLVVIDECHHLPAFSFESAIRRAPVRHFLGLTATPYRRDGLQEMVTMQCGPVRHEIATTVRDGYILGLAGTRGYARRHATQPRACRRTRSPPSKPKSPC
jgi:superfamily II DNA or RNA helicase